MGATSADGAGGAAEEACSGNATGIAAESASATIGGAGAVGGGGGGGGAKVATFSTAGALFEAGAADSDGACALTAAPARRRLPGASPAHAPGYISRTTLSQSSASSRVSKCPIC